jgi:hypothetical protein
VQLTPSAHNREGPWGTPESNLRGCSRLDAIGAALRDSGHALALLRLGSVGLDRDRLDRQSELDFFAIADPAYKAHYLADPDWPRSWRLRGPRCASVRRCWSSFKPQARAGFALRR